MGYFFSETGSSNNKCSDTYHGPEAFSEIETQNVRDYVLALEPVPVYALSLHSYSQLFLWPFGYEKGGPYPENVDEIVRNFLGSFSDIYYIPNSCKQKHVSISDTERKIKVVRFS